MQSVKRIIWTLVQNRLGFERTKFITMFIIMACPFAAPFILQKGAVIQRYIELLPPMLFYGTLLFVSLAAMVISACLSVCFYEHTIYHRQALVPASPDPTMHESLLFIVIKNPRRKLERRHSDFLRVLLSILLILPPLPGKHFPTFRPGFLFLLFPDRSWW